MKRTLIVALLICAIAAFGADRIVLGELFTNTGCGPCVSANDHFDDIYPDVDEIFVMVRYHVSWPSSADPFYMYNTSDPTTRKNFYGVSGVPYLALNGENISWSAGSIPYIRTEADEDAQYSVELVPLGLDSVRVIVTPDPGADAVTVKLFIITTEDSIHYSAPNGQTLFMQVMRDMLTGGGGLRIDLDGETPFVYSVPLIIDEDFVLENMHIVGFIQDATSDVVYNAGFAPLHAREAYAYSVTTSGPPMYIISPEEDVDFPFLLRNDGASEDRYHIWVVSDDVPEGWRAECTMEGMSFDSMAVNIPGVMSQGFTLNVSPAGAVGMGEIRVVVWSENLGTADTLMFTAQTPQALLLVNASWDATRADFYREYLDDMGIAYSYWDQEQYGEISAIDGVGYETVIWITGDNLTHNPLGVGPRAQFRTFLGGGGKLLLTGNTIGRFTSTDFAFYFQTLGAMYVTTKEDPPYAQILPGQDIASMRTVHLADGTRESIGAYSSGQLVAAYNDMTGAAVTNESHGGKSAYFAFALEDIANPETGARLLGNILDWLETGNAIDEEKSLPDEMALSSMYPNPFNGATAFTVAIPADGKYMLTVSDVSGRAVETIEQGDMARGLHNILWTPAQAVSSGIYFVRLRSETGEELTRKTVYLK